MATLRIREDIWNDVNRHLSPLGEHFAFLRARWTWSNGEPVLWTTGSALVPDEVVTIDRGAHEVPLETLLDNINKAVREGTTLIEVHNHGGSHPTWSPVDREGLRQVVPYMLSSLPGRPYVATVWAGPHIFGEWFGSDNRQGELRSIVVAGSGLRQLVSSNGTRDADRLETWSRQRLWFTEEGQRQLGRLRVAVIGNGGTGSLLVQNLAFLGVRDFVLVDPDLADATSMNRLVTGRRTDVGQPKVNLASRLIRSVAQKAAIQPFRADLRDKSAIDAVRGCDLIFGCMDNDGARLVLNELALAYQIPYIDLATGIDASQGKVTEAGGRVASVVPGGPCLNCMGEIDPDEARYFLAPDAERVFARDRGYVRGFDEVAPAVVSLNASVAAAAVNEFAVWFSGIRPINILSELDLIGTGRGKTAQWLTPKRVVRDPECVHCLIAATGDEANLGRYAASLDSADHLKPVSGRGRNKSYKAER